MARSMMNAISSCVRKLFGAKEIDWLDTAWKSADQEGAAGSSFWNALQRPGMTFICELGEEAEQAGLSSHLSQAIAYIGAGVDCIAYPVELETTEGIRQQIHAPVLFSDPVMKESGVYRASVLEANAVRLCVNLLSAEELARLLGICDQCGLAALVRATDEQEIHAALSAGARIVEVDCGCREDGSQNLSDALLERGLVPPGVLCVAVGDVKMLGRLPLLDSLGVNGILLREESVSEIIKLISSYRSEIGGRGEDIEED